MKTLQQYITEDFKISQKTKIGAKYNIEILDILPINDDDKKILYYNGWKYSKNICAFKYTGNNADELFRDDEKLHVLISAPEYTFYWYDDGNGLQTVVLEYYKYDKTDIIWISIASLERPEPSNWKIMNINDALSLIKEIIWS